MKYRFEEKAEARAIERNLSDTLVPNRYGAPGEEHCRHSILLWQECPGCIGILEMKREVPTLVGTGPVPDITEFSEYVKL